MDFILRCAKDSAKIPSDIDSYWMVYNKARSTYEKVKTLVITAVQEEEEVEEGDQMFANSLSSCSKI